MEEPQTDNHVEELPIPSPQEIKQPKLKRSLAVTIVSWFHVIQGCVLIGVSMLSLSALGENNIGLTELFDHINHDEVIALGVIFLILGLLTVIMGMGLRTLRPWTWLVAMLIQGANLATSLFAYFNHMPNYFAMFFGVLIVFLLNQREVRHAFRLWETELA